MTKRSGPVVSSAFPPSGSAVTEKSRLRWYSASGFSGTPRLPLGRRLLFLAAAARALDALLQQLEDVDHLALLLPGRGRRGGRDALLRLGLDVGEHLVAELVAVLLRLERRRELVHEHRRHLQLGL